MVIFIIYVIFKLKNLNSERDVKKLDKKLQIKTIKLNNFKIWKNETKCKNIIEEYFNKKYGNYKYKFNKIRHPNIVNPQTGRHLELDGYCPELELAFEYNGEQHYELNNIYNNNDNEILKKQKYRDEYKILRYYKFILK